MKRVLIADDQAVVRAGYRTFLSSESCKLQLGEASNGAELLAALQSRDWDLLILDLHSGDQSGIRVLNHVRQEFPQVRILAVSELPERRYAVEAFRAGAAGCLSKSCTRADLITAVRSVLGGRRYISATAAEGHVAELGKPSARRHEQLSVRERQVFDQLASGWTITAIAHDSQLSVKTVSTYRTRILDKMSLKSNAEIVCYSIHHGLTHPNGEIFLDARMRYGEMWGSSSEIGSRALQHSRRSIE